ncbi:recombinase RecF [Jiangella ureilytica]|uniref:Nuclease SbcCD subunit C n=1 Tax=Jiangella ureilytica TaxID=2530374 RepID=A0A4R4S4A4_9ACTN|nr:AAA family ATPase [Jiangella ureilytica]TDC56659.1 recombinase RecF [Jiangella ureilytica]
MTDHDGPDDGHVLSAVLELADADDTLTDESTVLVLAALESEAELAAALRAGRDEGSVPRPPMPAQSTPPVGAFVTSIRVEGFRGIGPAAELTLHPSPGLTVVAGRNGSGKSSFSEALELALTGDSYRWSKRTAVWSEHWRNLRSRAAARIRIGLAEEGAGTTTVGVDWADGAGLGDRQVWVQRPGGRRESGTGGLGWSRPLELYRPILSYEELGGILQDGPSRLFDALDAILGIEQATDALQRLAAVAKELEAPAKAVKAERTALKKVLAGSADERAAQAHDQLRRHHPDLAAVEAVATGRQAVQPVGDLARLRALTRLTVPAQDEVRAGVTELRAAAAEFEALAADAAELAARRAALLRQALELHREHGDVPCPVCGGGTLDAAWHEETEAALAAASASSEAYGDAFRRLDLARDQARSLVREVGEPVAADRFALQAHAPALTAWHAWSRPAADDDELAARLDTEYDRLAAAYARLRDEASAVLSEHEDAWTPLAVRLATWVEQARSVQSDDPAREQVDAAHRFMRAAVDELRTREFDRLADRAREIWAALRHDSNVDLGAIRPKGQGNRRHIELVAEVDGEDAGALGVMSQGELHALALALFIPRATMPGSPFRFIVLDDPIQAMDPAKVDGLVRVLAELAVDRQVIVLSHDDRLTSAVRQLGVDARILELSRTAGSAVDVRPGKDPAQRHLDDAFAVARDGQVPADIALRVLPGLCRAAVEAAARDVYFAARFRAGASRVEVERVWQSALRTRQRLGLALSGDADMNLSSWRDRKHWRRTALGIVGSGAHDGLRSDPIGALRDVERLVQELRLP